MTFTSARPDDQFSQVGGESTVFLKRVTDLPKEDTRGKGVTSALASVSVLKGL
jgi:hypothetical protein